MSTNYQDAIARMQPMCEELLDIFFAQYPDTLSDQVRAACRTTMGDLLALYANLSFDDEVRLDLRNAIACTEDMPKLLAMYVLNQISLDEVFEDQYKRQHLINDLLTEMRI